MAYRVLKAADAFWRRSNQMQTPNTDIGGQLEASALGARMWQVEPGKASTFHRHFTQEELYVLLEGGSMRFSEIGSAVPNLSDRLLSERMKELEARGIVEREVREGSPARVEYSLTEMGRELAPALRELREWALRYL